MKKKSVKLSIDEPCHEDWNAMTPQEKGRFCDVCSKVVVDFTNMSDSEVLSLLTSTKNGDTCGQFTQSQLERTFHHPVQQTNTFNLRAVLLGATLTSVLGLESCKSSNSVTGMVYMEEQTEQVSTLSDTNNNESAHSDEKLEVKVFGKVIGDPDSKGLKDVEVQVFFVDVLEPLKVKTNDAGAFIFSVHEPQEVAYLVFQCNGYAQRRLTNEEFNATSMNVRMNVLEEETILKGKVKIK